MRFVAYVRRGARAGICVLAMGATDVSAQQVPAETPPANTEQGAPAANAPAQGTETATPAESAPPTPAATSELPELVVDAAKKKEKKKTAKAKDQVAPVSTAGEATTTENPAPSVTYGTGAPADTGTATFDAKAVDIRTNGNGDANTFIRNLPNVQYQTQSDQNAGVTSTKLVDTRPALMSISGGRTYENNFIVNGVSTTNITGSVARGSFTAASSADSIDLAGLSPQTQYIPSDFIGTATVIDSNASAEYGQFVGGVVVYDLLAPPTDRYRASVTASRDSSDYANYLLATRDGTNQLNRVAPTYEKTNLSVSLGAPITPDFAFVAQASRREAESTKPAAIALAAKSLDEWSDNIFLRFAATARTDIGKFTLDVSRTDYFQRFVNIYDAPDSYYDISTESLSTQLKFERDLTAVRADGIGFGRVKLKSTAFYNDSETTNDGSNGTGRTTYVQGFSNYVAGQGWTNVLWDLDDAPDWCSGVDPATFPQSGVAQSEIRCADRNDGDLVQSQEDFGLQANLSGDLLLGTFKLGGDIKQYEGRKARLSEQTGFATNYILNDTTDRVYSLSGTTAQSGATFTKFNCAQGDQLCGDQWLSTRYTYWKTYDLTKTLNAVHSFAEVDQTLGWFNLRAGVRLDYDDYFKNLNLAPRLAGTVTPFDGVSFTGGFNRYYLGESLYYALRDGIPNTTSRNRISSGGIYWNSATGTPNGWGAETTTPLVYKFGELDTPYSDEYTAAVRIKDPLLGGQLRVKYLERYGRDEFSTVPGTGCSGSCWTAGNNGESTYRSASAEYGKSWDNLRNPFFLNAAAINGSVTWSKQWKSQDNYIQSADIDGSGDDDVSRKVWYNGTPYDPRQFSVVTGNMDIPVRFGATLATVWLDDLLELNLNAGVNLGYQGVYFDSIQSIGGTSYNLFKDWSYTTALKLDLSGRVNVTEQAAIDFHVDNITNSTQSYVSTYSNPWVIGRSFWVGTTLKLQ